MRRRRVQLEGVEVLTDEGRRERVRALVRQILRDLHEPPAAAAFELIALVGGRGYYAARFALRDTGDVEAAVGAALAGEWAVS